MTYFSGHLVFPDLTPQSAFLGFYLITENMIILNQIFLTFKLVIYKSQEAGSCNLVKIINKIKQTKVIEDNISFKNENVLSMKINGQSFNLCFNF